MHFHQLNRRSKKIKSENKVRTSKSRFEAVQYFSWTSLTNRKKYIVLLPSSWVCRIACSACSPAQRGCVFGMRNVSFSENIAHVLNGWPQFTYSLFQIKFCWFDYISFCLFTANLLSLTLLTSSNGWKLLSIFEKSVLNGLLRGYSKITSIRKGEESPREVWQKTTGERLQPKRWCHLLKCFSVPSYVSDTHW